MRNAAWSRFDAASNTLTLVLHVQPGARTTEVAGRHGDALKIRLQAAPVEGQANLALVGYLAQAFGVPRRQVSIRRGEASRHKEIAIVAPTRRPDLGW